MRILKILLIFPLLLALCACASGGETAQKEKPAAPAQAVLSGGAKAADAPKPSAPSPDVLDFHLQAMPEEEYSGVFYASSAEARGLPLEEASVTGTLENMLTRVYCTIRTDDGLWSLVDVLNLAESMDTLGWVRWETLAPYDAETMESTLTYPVRVRAGMTLTYARTGYTVTTRGDEAWKLRYNEDGTVVLLDVGGIEFPVERTDLRFPRVEGNAIVWE